MGKLTESDAKSKAEHQGYEIMTKYIQNRHQSDLEEVQSSLNKKEKSLQELNNNVVDQLQSKLSKEESTNINREAQLKQWHDNVVDQLQSKQSKKESHLNEKHNKVVDQK